MNKLFSIDGLFYKIGTIIIDLLYMNLLWVLFTVIGFGVTGGASTASLFRIMQRRAQNKGNCNFEEFLYGFKKFFKRSTIIWLSQILIVIISVVNIHYIPFFKSFFENTYLAFIILIVQILVLIEVLAISIYIYNVVVKYDINLVGAFKIAFVLVYKNILATITCIALAIVVGIGYLSVPIIFCVGVSGYAMLSSLILKNKLNI